jgi:hypothetical protein
MSMNHAKKAAILKANELKKARAVWGIAALDGQTFISRRASELLLHRQPNGNSNEGWSNLEQRFFGPRRLPIMENINNLYNRLYENVVPMSFTLPDEDLPIEMYDETREG